MCASYSKSKHRVGKRVNKYFKHRKTLMRKRCMLRKKLDSSNCDDQNCGYEQKIRDIEKCICESHRDEQKQDEPTDTCCLYLYVSMRFKIMSKVVKYTCRLRQYDYPHDQLNTRHFIIVFYFFFF